MTALDTMRAIEALMPRPLREMTANEVMDALGAAIIRADTAKMMNAPRLRISEAEDERNQQIIAGFAE